MRPRSARGGETHAFSEENADELGSFIAVLGTTVGDAVAGCYPFTNRWSLNDANRLYEAILSGAALSTTRRDELFARMNALNPSESMLSALHQIVSEEAAQLLVASPPVSLTATKIQLIKQKLALHYKAGHHYHPLGLHNTSASGIARIPRCSGASQSLRDYVWGMFVHGGESDSKPRVRAAQPELLRAPIRDSLKTWQLCTP